MDFATKTRRPAGSARRDRLAGILLASTLALACSGGPASSTTAVSDSDGETEASTSSTTAGSTSTSTGAPGTTSTDGSTTSAPPETTDASTTSATSQTTGPATTGSPTTSEGATTSETTGGLECEEHPKYSCDGPIDCDGNSCGGLSDYFDESGCLRPTCKMDSDCPDGQKCYIGFQFDDCLSSDFTCFTQQGACECVSTDDCGGAHCVPEEIYPG